MSIGDRNALRVRRRWRLDREVLHHPTHKPHAQVFGLLVGSDRRRVGRRRHHAVDDVTARNAAALSAREHAQKPGGYPADRRGVLIIADVDHPAALPERDAGKARGIEGVELGLVAIAAVLGARRRRRQRKKRGCDCRQGHQIALVLHGVCVGGD